MRVVFAGTPAVAIPGLDALVASEHEIAAVITRPDAPVGRKRVLTPSPVAAHAHALGLPVVRAARSDDELTAAVAAMQPDLGVVIAYGALLRAPLLTVPRLGWINLHFSLLPRWRGAAPVQRAVIAGDAMTGASVFQLEIGMDTGPVFASIERAIAPDDTAGSLLDALADDGAQLLREVVDALAGGTAIGTAQTGEPTLAPKLTLADAAIDPTETLDRVSSRVRGTTPEPGPYVIVGGDRLKLLDTRPVDEPAPAATISEREGRILLGVADGALELLAVHPAGKKPMAAADWWRGVSAESLVVEAPA